MHWNPSPGRLVARSALGAVSTHIFAVRSQDLEALVPENELGRRHNHQEVRLGFENRQHQLDGVELPAILLKASPMSTPYAKSASEFL